MTKDSKVSGSTFGERLDFAVRLAALRKGYDSGKELAVAIGRSPTQLSQWKKQKPKIDYPVGRAPIRTCKSSGNPLLQVLGVSAGLIAYVASITEAPGLVRKWNHEHHGTAGVHNPVSVSNVSDHEAEAKVRKFGPHRGLFRFRAGEDHHAASAISQRTTCEGLPETARAAGDQHV